MQVSKWGNSLGVRLPKAFVEKLDLKPGDELELIQNEQNTFELRKSDKRRAFQDAMAVFNFPAPEGYKFDRDEANSR